MKKNEGTNFLTHCNARFQGFHFKEKTIELITLT